MENLTEHILKLNSIILELFEILDDIYEQKEFCGALEESEAKRLEELKNRFYRH